MRREDEDSRRGDVAILFERKQATAHMIASGGEFSSIALFSKAALNFLALRWPAPSFHKLAASSHAKLVLDPDWNRQRKRS